MNYVLDTNIILFYLKDGPTKELIETTYGPFASDNTAIISIVTVAEIKALAQKNKWGDKRIKIVEKILGRLAVIEITYGELLDAYAEIDAFSQGKLDQPSSFSARNMGKNDLWIAATTKITNSTLLTSDRDFDHLQGNYFEVLLIENIDSKKS